MRKKKDDNILKRTVSVMLKINPKLEVYPIFRRWFEEATQIRDQALYFLRQEYFWIRKWKREAPFIGIDFVPNYGRFKAGDNFLYKLCNDEMKGTISVPSCILRNITSGPFGIMNVEWISYLKAIKKYYEDRSRFKEKPRIPGYLHNKRTGVYRRFFPIVFSRSSRDIRKIDVENRTAIVGNIMDPNNRITIKIPPVVDIEKFTYIRMVWRSKDRIEVFFGYDVEKPDLSPYQDRVLGIDLGGVNVVAMTVNGTEIDRSWIVKCGIINSINQFCNKMVARYKSVLAKTGNGKKTSKRIQRIWKKRDNKLDYEFNCLSKRIIQLCVENKIGRIVIGHNKGWKQNINLGKKTNQKFVQIPFNDLIWKIRYKAEDVGIVVEVTEESYTSKVDHLAGEEMARHENYLGDREERGLFRSSTGKILNADINGAIGILRKNDALSQGDLEHMKERTDISSPERLEYKPRQGSILGVGKGKAGSWRGNLVAKKFTKNTRERCHVFSVA